MELENNYMDLENNYMDLENNYMDLENNYMDLENNYMELFNDNYEIPITIETTNGYYNPISKNIKEETLNINEIGNITEETLNINEIGNITENIGEKTLNMNELRNTYHKMKKKSFKFQLEKKFKNKYQKIENEFQNEIHKYKEALGKNFKPCRGRARQVQLKGFSLNDKEIDKKLRLSKNQYSAKKVRYNNNYKIKSSDEYIKFLENKIKNYELLFEKIII